MEKLGNVVPSCSCGGTCKRMEETEQGYHCPACHKKQTEGKEENEQTGIVESGIGKDR